jgi:hypothetical protein
MHDKINTGPQVDPRANEIRARSPRSFDHGAADCAKAASPMAMGEGVATSRPRFDDLSFSEALERLKQGARVARRNWNGRGQFIELQVPDYNSKMSLPYIFIHTVQGDLVPWLASQTDMLANDWCIVSERSVLVYGHPHQEV